MRYPLFRFPVDAGRFTHILAAFVPLPSRFRRTSLDFAPARLFAPPRRTCFGEPSCIPPDIDCYREIVRTCAVRGRLYARSARPPGSSHPDRGVCPGVGFRFSIKRNTSAPEKTPHPENPAYSKRPSGHNFRPDSHQRHIKYHRNKGLSSRKPSKKPFFSVFGTENRPLTFFASHFGISRALLGRSLSRARKCTPSFPRVAKRDLCSNCSQKMESEIFASHFGMYIIIST